VPVTNTVTAYQYKIEVSSDGTAFTTVLDQSKNDIARNTIFEQFAPAKCRYVRLTMTNWPRSGPLGRVKSTGVGALMGEMETGATGEGSVPAEPGSGGCNVGCKRRLALHEPFP
jgi:hypothetical protein